eukprot:gene10798-14496_t
MISLKVRIDTLLDRLNSSKFRLETLERRLTNNDDENSNEDNIISMIQSVLLEKMVFTSRMYIVHDDYYNWDLDQRAKVLGCKKEQLCKSIIFENTMCDHNETFDPTDSKYYCVIIQYIAKINVNYLRTLVHELRIPEKRISKKKFQFQLAPDEMSLKLSGFEHNAITPFGMKVNIPIIICSKCSQVNPPVIYLGGGKVNAKLSIPISDFIKSTKAIVGNVSDLR